MMVFELKISLVYLYIVDFTRMIFFFFMTKELFVQSTVLRFFDDSGHSFYAGMFFDNNKDELRISKHTTRVFITFYFPFSIQGSNIKLKAFG